MAAPAYKASGTFTAGIASITPPYPTGGNAPAANDIAILVVTSENQAISLTTANGFVEVGAQANKAAGTAATDPACRVAVYWKRCAGGDSAPVVADSGNNQTAQIHLFTGCETTGNPWDVFAEGNDSAANDTSGSIPGATTTVVDTLVVLIAGSSRNATGTAEFSAWTNADLTSLTERTDNTDTSGLGGGHGMATGVKASAGAYGATTVTYSATSFKGMMSIALKPPGVVTHQGSVAFSAESSFTPTPTIGTAYTREVEHFDGLADGASILTTTGIFDSGGTTSSTVVADLDQIIRPGQPSMMGVATAAAGTWTRQINLRGTTSEHTPKSYWRTYFRTNTIPVASASFVPIVSARNSAAAVCAQLGIVSNATTLKMRNTQTATGTGVSLSANTWYRIEWRLDWNAQVMRLRVWTGATLHSEDPADAILNEQATWDSVNGPPQHLRWGEGVAPDADTTFWFAALGWQTTDWLGPEPLADLSADGSMTAAGTLKKQGAADFSAEGVMTATATVTPGGGVTHQGAADFSAQSSLTADDTLTTFGALAASAEGTMTAAGTVRALGSAGFSAESSLTVTATLRKQGALSASAESSFTVTATLRKQGSATLTGESSLTTTALLRKQGAASLSGEGVLTAAALRTAQGAAALAADGALTAAGSRTAQGAATLAGDGTLTASGLLRAQASAAFSAEGVMTATAGGVQTHQGSVAFSAESSLTATPLRIAQAALAVSAESSLTVTGARKAVGWVQFNALDPVKNLCPDFDQWTLAGGATVNAQGELVMTGSGQSASIMIYLGSNQEWSVSAEQFPTAEGIAWAGQNLGGRLASSLYFAEDGVTPVYNNNFGWPPVQNSSGGWTGNGNARGSTVGQWSTRNATYWAYYGSRETKWLRIVYSWSSQYCNGELRMRRPMVLPTTASVPHDTYTLRPEMFTATVTRLASATLTADGSMVPTAVLRKQGAATLTAEGTLTSTPLRKAQGTVAFQGDSALTVAGLRKALAAMAVSAESGLTVTALRRAIATLLLEAEGTLTADAIVRAAWIDLDLDRDTDSRHATVTSDAMTASVDSESRGYAEQTGRARGLDLA